MELLPNRLYKLTFKEGRSWYARVVESLDNITGYDQFGNRFVESGKKLALYRYATNKRPSAWFNVSRLTKIQAIEITLKPWQKISDFFCKLGDCLMYLLD